MKKDDKQVGTNDEVFQATDQKSYSQTRKKYMIMFKENRSFDLYVGRSYNHFGPHGQLEVDSEFINHPDFIQQKKYFAIREL